MSNNAVVLSEANLDILEDNLGKLASNLGTLSSNMVRVDDKVNDVTNSVKTIEEEIKQFMYEIRESTIVANAKQSILMAQNELEKKYGHYDNVRRKLSGLLQSTDLNAIKTSTIEAMSEETLVSTPDYYLAPALVALSAWFTNNKELAYRALNESIKRNDEKTSLLFSLIHLRANRRATSLKWLKRYLDKQDPANMENIFITVLDAISSGVYGIEAKALVLNKVRTWMNILKTNPECENKQIERWNNVFKDLTVESKELVFPYIEKYTTSVKEVTESYNFAKSRKNIYNYINNIEKKDSTRKNINKIDKIINLLIFNYENEELELKKEIEKNNLIIKSNGDLKKSEENFKQTSLAYQEKTDFYTILSNIIMEDSIETLNETKKLALSLSKEFILKSYNNYNEEKLNNSISNIEITINDWKGNTIDGKNERELMKSLNDFIINKNKIYVNSEKFINFKVMIATIICIIACFLLRSTPIFIFLFIGLTLAFDAYEIFNIYKRRNIKINKVNEECNNKKNILLNVIGEIVDFKYAYKETSYLSDNIVKLLNSLNYENYIKTNNERDIMFGGFNNE